MTMADMEQLKQFCKGSNICLKEITYHNLTLFYQLSFCHSAPNFIISTIVNYIPHSSFSSSQYTSSSYLKLAFLKTEYNGSKKGCVFVQ